jgi:hypothetical protein
MTLTVRSATVTGATTKGSALTHAELDENFNHLSQSSGVSFTQSGSGAVATTVQNRIRAGKPILLDFIPTARHSEIAAGTCTTDLTTYIASAITAIGEGTLEAPRGGLPFEGTIDVLTGVNLVGQGGSSTNPGTTFKAQNAAAIMKFGARTTGSYGGKSGGFLLDGNDLATQLLYLGRTLERTFQNISVIDCAAGSSAVLLEESQNNQFFGFMVTNNKGDGVRFDRGAAGNRIFGPEINANGVTSGYNVNFTASAAGISGLTDYPQNNHFFGGLVERDGGGILAQIYHGAGADNHFWGVNVAAGTVTRESPLVLMEIGNAAVTSQSIRLYFHGCQFTGTQLYTTGFDLDDAVSVYIEGNPLIQGMLNLYHLRDTSSRIYRPGYTGVPAASNVTNTVSTTSTGTISQEQVLLSKLIVTNATTLDQTTINGDSNGLLTIEKAAGTDIINVHSNSSILQLVNGCDVQMYSGNYSGSVLTIDGATGNTASAGSIKSSSATGGIGYATGAGGSVAQGSGSGKATGVTLSTMTGEITMDGAILNADTTVSFTLTNTSIDAGDHVVVQHVSGGTVGSYLCTAVAGADSATIYVRNITPGNLTEAPVLKFSVIKAVTA